jgi:uncharacterized membrane protein YdjX (TVP38/TMEM64 family)
VERTILDLLEQHPQLAIAISLSISILIAILGVLPSFFVTAANIAFFGFWNGTLISFLGEALGAAVSFVLYRMGFKKLSRPQLDKHPKVRRLIEAEGREAFLLIVALRLIPFVPSGLVTFVAAIGKVTLATFVLASSLGKAPALLMEAYSVYQVTRFGWQGKLILMIVAIVILYQLLRRKKQ